MSTVFIGRSSFLSRNAQKVLKDDDIVVLSHEEGLDASKWPKSIKVAINFATDPKTKKGEYSDLDHQLAKITAQKNGAYIMLSSRAVYGVAAEPKEFIESQKPEPVITPYGHAKRLIEDDLIEHFDHITILRMSNIFGFEYEEGKDRQTFLGMLLKNLKEKDIVRFNMSPQTQRDFVPVPVFASWLGSIAKKPETGIFNLGSGFGTATGDIADWIIRGYGSGSVSQIDNEIKDSFVLNMAHTRNNYDLISVKLDDIRQYCIEIGKKLK